MSGYHIRFKHGEKASHDQNDSEAVAAGVVENVWSLDDVVDMVERFLRAEEERAYEDAFSEAEFTDAPKINRTWKPRVMTPWYLDPESGGPCPPMSERKEGVRHEQGEPDCNH